MEYPVHVHELKVADPCIMADPDSKKYYMYSNKFSCGVTPTERDGTGNTFYAICSEDLVNWSNPILVFEQNDFWPTNDYISPEGHYYKGKYYIIASFSNPGSLRRCQALVSESPLGPFKPISQQPLTPPAWHCVDGTLYIDTKGKPWLVFCHDWVQVFDGQICALPLSEDLGSAIGDPVILFRASEAPWGDDFVYTAADGGGVTKGPWLHRMADGALLMLWSGYTPFGLAVGIAKSLSGEIFGPWKQFDKPVFCHDGGHASLFRRFNDGMLMMSLYTRGEDGPGIRTLIYEVEEYEGLIETINEFTGNWADSIGGHPIKYRSKVQSKDIPTFSELGNYGGFFARLKTMNKWAMAPESKFKKGKIFKEVVY